MSTHDDVNDDEPDVNDPTLDEFTRTCEDQYDDDGVVELIGARGPVIAKIQTALANAIAPLLEINNEHKGIYHIEMFVALGNIFIGFAEHLLKNDDVDTWQRNRDQALTIIGVMAAHVNTMKPKGAGFKDMPTSATKH